MERESNPHIQYPVEHSPLEPRSNMAIMLPGQDVRRLGMFDEAMENPAGREVLERGHEFLLKNYGYNLLELAATTPDPDKAQEKSELLSQTRFTQPAVYLESMAIHNANRQQGREGYKTKPDFYSGVSMGMGTAATLAGFMNFEQGLYFHAERGKIMQEQSVSTPTSMVALVNAKEEQVLRLLGEEHNSDIDLCLINSDTLWVVGGPDDPMDPRSSMQEFKREAKEKKIRTVDVDTDRAMHGRYVRSARPAFDALVDSIKFNKPTSAVVGSLTGLPIRDEEQMKEELKVGFDHTIDNRKPLIYFDAVGIHVFSEVGSTKGNFGRTMERAFGSRALQTIAAISAVGVGVGLGVYEVATRHHPNHPDKNQE
jgi:malonyl CoA-acyl carrier protein transacylase